eukprot:scaffold3493_cov84-Isochrysis_galbana.AAC.5
MAWRSRCMFPIRSLVYGSPRSISCSLTSYAPMLRTAIGSRTGGKALDIVPGGSPTASIGRYSKVGLGCASDSFGCSDRHRMNFAYATAASTARSYLRRVSSGNCLCSSGVGVTLTRYQLAYRSFCHGRLTPA